MIFKNLPDLLTPFLSQLFRAAAPKAHLEPAYNKLLDQLITSLDDGFLTEEDDSEGNELVIYWRQEDQAS